LLGELGIFVGFLVLFDLCRDNCHQRERFMDAKQLFEILVRENADMLIAYIRSTARNDALAEDIFQETMLTAWRRLDDYDRDRPFGPWLRGIAARVLLAHRRKAARGLSLCDEETLDYLSQSFETLLQRPGDTFDDKLDALRDCVSKLPEPYREPIKLRYGENIGVSGLVARLGLAAGTIKKRLQRAKTRLLDCINRKLGAAET
jgi:RNA polymerase sigma-70 factor